MSEPTIPAKRLPPEDLATIRDLEHRQDHAIGSGCDATGP